ncbi:MAG: ribokinase [Chloroflexus aggregans]|uniref:Ribokinase n=1 Tax=Chloroflexus aggregans TaxID=152260 RepID=A0A2J6XFC6_9CHLR|nr:MAG: ribokinase [Chloroflexus aggregans]
MVEVIAFGNPVYDEIITPVVRTEGRVLSGCSTNACLALGRLGRTTALVGRVGPDYADRFQSDLMRYGITPFVERASQTGGFKLVYDSRGDRTLDVLGVAEPITMVPDVVTTAAAVVVGPILQETSLEFIYTIRTRTQAPIFLDPQGLLRRIGADGRIEHFLPVEFAAIAPLCHVIKANEVEAKVITGIDPRSDPVLAARRLRETGCAIAIVTIAEAGSQIDDGDRSIAIPAFPTDARDPTGAGDTYMAGFLHAYLANPSDLFRAGCTGAATASIWIEYTGPDAPITLAEVERRTAFLVQQDR